METITNAATTVGTAAINATTAAKNTIFGPGEGQEPVSGESGKGTAVDPYDKGNAEDQPGTDKAASSDPDPKAPTTTDVGAAAPDSGTEPKQKQQGADRPEEEPGKENVEAIKDKKDDAEDKMESGGSSEPKGDPPKALGEKKDGPSGNKDELGSTSKEPGTGTKHEKTSGLAADGGNFDATKPGAAKEADRLLEEKGIHREGPNTGPPQTPEVSKERKPSIASRIKEKLHIGSKKDKTKDADKSKDADKPKEESKTNTDVTPKEGTALEALKGVDLKSTDKP